MYSEESQLKLENFESHVSYFHRFFCKLWKGHMPTIGKEMKLYILFQGPLYNVQEMSSGILSSKRIEINFY